MKRRRGACRPGFAPERVPLKRRAAAARNASGPASAGRTIPGADFPSFLRRLMAVLAAVAVAALVVHLSGLLLMAFGGVLLALGLRGAAERIGAWTGLPARWGVFVVIALALAALGLLGWLVGSRAAEQFSQLSQTLPQAIGRVEAWLQAQPWGAYLLDQAKRQGGGGQVLSQITGAAFTLLGVLTDVVLVILVTVFIALNPGLYQTGAVRLFPIKFRARAMDVLNRTGHALRVWMLGQLAAMIMVGALTTLGLALIDAPLPLALGLLAGLLDFIPFVGPLIAAVPALLVALTASPQMVLWVALLYFAIQQFEGNVLIPLIQQRAVSLPPALTILATVTMGVLLGFPGLVFATPLLVAAMVVVRMVYVGDVLGDRAFSDPV